MVGGAGRAVSGKQCPSCTTRSSWRTPVQRGPQQAVDSCVVRKQLTKNTLATIPLINMFEKK